MVIPDRVGIGVICAGMTTFVEDSITESFEDAGFKLPGCDNIRIIITKTMKNTREIIIIDVRFIGFFGCDLLDDDLSDPLKEPTPESRVTSFDGFLFSCIVVSIPML
jgi:hypothetical protein